MLKIGLISAVLALVLAPNAPIFAQEAGSSTDKGFMPDLMEFVPAGPFETLFKGKQPENTLDKAKNAVLDEVEQGVDMAGKAIQGQIEQQARQGLEKLKIEAQGFGERALAVIKNISAGIKNIFSQTYKKIFKSRATF